MKCLLTFVTILLMSLAACSHGGEATQPLHEEMNSAYYWKTVFRLDSADIDFLDRHDIGRIYLRMFDVVHDPECHSIDEMAQPNASVKIDDNSYDLLQNNSLRDREFVPVVYITLDALKAMEGHEGRLAENIVKRVKNMCRYNAIPNVRELQFDCDWTAGTERSFFLLCDSAKKSIAGLDLPWRLSSTIRLHQLARKAPPVDNGVLMVYNTGSFNDPDVTNSIIDAKDVTPPILNISGAIRSTSTWPIRRIPGSSCSANAGL